MTNFQKLLNSGKPFAVVFSDSNWGSDTFFLMYDNDAPAKMGFTPGTLTRAHELTMDSEDIHDFLSVKNDGEWQAVSLGDDGTAYELKRVPFRDYWKETRRPKRKNDQVHA